MIKFSYTPLWHIALLLFLITHGCKEEKQHVISMKLIESYSNADLMSAIDSANRLLAYRKGVVVSDTGYADFESYANNNPIFAILRPNIQMNSDGQYYPGVTSDIGYISAKDTAELTMYFHDSAITALLPPDMELIFAPNAVDKLSAYAIRKQSAIQQLTADHIKHFEFKSTGLSGVTGIIFNDDEFLFFIHLSDDLINKLPENQAYTILMNIDSTTLTGSYTRTNPPAVANMNSISKQNKDIIEKMFNGKVID